MTADEVLVALVFALEQLRQVLPDDKTEWDNNVLVRLAVERLWITAGNLAEAYRIEEGIGAGIEPWSELAGYRRRWRRRRVHQSMITVDVHRAVSGDQSTRRPTPATLDHIISVSKGGPNTADNLATCCMTCNSIKTGRTYDEAAPQMLAHLASRRGS